MFDLIIDQISQVTLHAPSMSVLCSLVGVCVLLLLSGFASGSEIAFFSLAPKELSELNPEHSSRDKSIQMLRDDSERTLATILITNNFVNVTIIMLCNYIFARVVDFGEAYWLQFLYHGFADFSSLAFRRDYPKGLQPYISACILQKNRKRHTLLQATFLAYRDNSSLKWNVSRKGGTD